jgi:LuxR family quorum-sensing system transcriptional regulator CciR
MADEFARAVDAAVSPAELAELLKEILAVLGFRYFALTQHADMSRATQPVARIHNYPQGWVRYFDDNGLGPIDPVHRASHLTSIGFTWSSLCRMIRLDARDRDILDRAAKEGIGEGYTVPVHVPGEIAGSCSFATAGRTPIREELLPLAQLVGMIAFEKARLLWDIRDVDAQAKPRLTDRQRDCVFWAARGKSDWEIAQILGISHETVTQHLKQARERYGVSKRTQLTVHALFDGTLTFADLIPR